MQGKNTQKKAYLFAFIVVCVVLFEVLFIKLGIWQFNRMHEKENIKQQMLVLSQNKSEPTRLENIQSRKPPSQRL